MDEKELYLRIKVIPSAARTELKEILADETFKIAVKAPPEKNKANQELIKFLGREFKCDKSSVKIISGQTDRLKLVKIKLWTLSA